MDGGTEFDGQGSEMGVRRDVAASTVKPELAEDKLCVQRAGVGDPHHPAHQPLFYMAHGDIDLGGLPEDSGVGPEADEAERNDPGDSDGLAS